MYVTCVPLSGRATVASGPVTWVPPVGWAFPVIRSGGHVLVHDPVHWKFPGVSGFRWYSVSPRASTRTVPMPFAVPVFTVSTATPPGWAVGDPPAAVGVFDP